MIPVACNNVDNNLNDSVSRSKSETKCILIGTRYDSFDALKEDITISYSKSGTQVQVIHSNNDKSVLSVLKKNISSDDLVAAQKGGFRKKAEVLFKSPLIVLFRKDIVRVRTLSRWTGWIFGEGDKCFYDLATAMTQNIIKEDIEIIKPRDFEEKGYLNSFNHLTAQAFLTAIFSEEFADYIADIHELSRLPELVSGNFSKEQIEDLDNGPLDNYVDMINNEWGQELGKELKKKLRIDRSTIWTPELLTTFLNEIQSYCSWAMDIRITPFEKTNETILRFSDKLKIVMDPNFQRFLDNYYSK